MICDSMHAKMGLVWSNTTIEDGTPQFLDFAGHAAIIIIILFLLRSHTSMVCEWL